MQNHQEARGSHMSQQNGTFTTDESAKHAVTGTTALGAVLDVFQVRQYLNLLVGASDLMAGRMVRDAGFVNDLRRAVLSLPCENRPKTSVIFPPAEPQLPGAGPGRLGLVASGGSGALVTIIGVVRALEEAGGSISVCSLCSGGALFGFPLAAGLSSQEAAELTMGLEPREYIDVSWGGMARALPSLGRGWAGAGPGSFAETSWSSTTGGTWATSRWVSCGLRRTRQSGTSSPTGWSISDPGPTRICRWPVRSGWRSRFRCSCSRSLWTAVSGATEGSWISSPSTRSLTSGHR
jgi:hypothetical protein